MPSEGHVNTPNQGRALDEAALALALRDLESVTKRLAAAETEYNDMSDLIAKKQTYEEINFLMQKKTELESEKDRLEKVMQKYDK